MKRLLSVLFSALVLAFPALAQLPPSTGVSINNTPVQGGTTAQCLYITTARKVGSQACGTGTAADIKVGTTTVSSGTTTRILYDNAGVLGEMTTTGSGTVVVLATTPTLVTPILGVATGTSLALGGATIGSNALAVTGTALFNGAVTLASGISISGSGAGTSSGFVDYVAQSAGSYYFNARSVVRSGANGSLTISNNAETNSFILTAAAASATPNMQLGAAAVDTAPVAQTLSVQNTLAGGTSNVAGADWSLVGSLSKGNLNGGRFLVKLAQLGASGTTVNAAATIGGWDPYSLIGAKVTDPATAPGAGFTALRWVAGTNAGTAKLVAYAGTSTTPVTVVDNVGGGF